MQEIKRFTLISKEEQAITVRWVSRQTDEILIECFKKQKNFFYELKAKNQHSDLNELSCAAFILAVSKVKNSIAAKSSKSTADDLSKIKSSIKIRIKQMKKQNRSHKYDQLLNKKSILIKLKEASLSYRECSDYFQKYHKLSVSHTLISQVYKDLIAAKIS